MGDVARNNAHPLYTAMLRIWEKNRDCYKGEDAIKEKGKVYLPPTSGMIADGFGGADPNSLGNQAYEAYKMRAVFVGLIKDAVETAIGVMHREPPVIELTPRLESLLEDATYDHEPLHMVLRKINEQQLVTGRLGLLGDFRADMEVENGQMPVLVIYYGETIFNWDDVVDEEMESNLRFVALDESTYEIQSDFAWKYVQRVRLLGLTDQAGDLADLNPEENNDDQVSGVYSSAELREQVSLLNADLQPLNLMGQELNRIPFSFINAKDLTPSPDLAPLDDLCNIALAAYRGEADYRQNLFMQGQDTLVISDGTGPDEDKPLRTGAGARIDLSINGRAEYVGTNSNGLQEQRTALENDYQRAEAKTAKLVNARGQESGEALALRMAAQTATLPQIAMAGAAGLQKVLRDLAVWFGEDPEQVTVTPNLDFGDSLGDAPSLVQIMQAKIQGAPISQESIHNWMREQGFTKLDYEAELEALNNEGVIGGGTNSTIPARRGTDQATTDPQQTSENAGAEGSGSA